MNKNLLKSAAVYAGLGAFVLVGFQNCSQVGFKDATAPIDQSTGVQSPNGSSDPVVPTLTPQPTPPVSTVTQTPTKPALSLVPAAAAVLEGQSVGVTVTFQDVTQVSYKCKDRVTGDTILSGNIGNSGDQIPGKISQDLQCEATANSTSVDTPVTAQADIAVDCGNRLKNSGTGRCEDFTCKKVVELQKTDLGNIPKRTIEGICYAVKLFDAIPKSKSYLNQHSDSDVLSANHDGGADHHPYIMDSTLLEFRSEGQRVVKLAGGASATAPILVDNFVLVGVYPSSVDPSLKINDYYKVMGTSDSSITDNQGHRTNSVQFGQTLIPIKSFGGSGTSTIAPLDITASVAPAVFHKLDLRALDCGGDRELSNIFLLFQ